MKATLTCITNFVLTFLAISITTGPYSPFTVSAQEISDELEAKVKERLFDSAYYSWELGTLTQVVLEFDVPSLSIFSAGSVPPDLSSLPTVNASNSGTNTSSLTQVTYYNTTLLTPIYAVSQRIVSSLIQSYGGSIPSNASQPLVINDGAAGDPPSLGNSILLFNWTQWGNQESWGRVAQNQINYLFRSVPRTNEGAISHRSEEVQVWSDFVYMVPPFLAYYGALQQDYDMLYEAYDQIRLYRMYLRDPGSHNLWKHILFGGRIPWDEGHWATGNGWACLGMLRVAATILHTPYADSMTDQVADLLSWTLEVQQGMVLALDNSTFMFTNYLNVPPEPSDWNFYDAAAGALFAYSVYVLSNVFDIHNFVPEADLVRRELSYGWVDGEGITKWWKHFDDEGYLFPVVNPRSFGEQGEKSPEGQAFVLGMQAAYKEWKLRGSHMPPARPVGTNSANHLQRLISHGTWGAVWWLAVLFTNFWTP